MKSTHGKPSTVATATKLLYLTLAIGVVRSFIEFNRLAESTFLVLVLTISVIMIRFIAWLIYLIDRGRNWARITFLVLFPIGVPLSILPKLQSLEHSPISGVLGIAQSALQAVALFLLFRRDSRPWFQPA